MNGGTVVALVIGTGTLAVAGVFLFGARTNDEGGHSCAVQDSLFLKVMEKARAGGIPETLAGLIEDDWKRLTCTDRARKLLELVANGVS